MSTLINLTNTQNKTQIVWQAVCIAAARASFGGRTPEGDIVTTLWECGISPLLIVVGKRTLTWDIHCFKCRSRLSEDCPTFPQILWGSSDTDGNNFEPLSREVIARIIRSREDFLAHVNALLLNA